MKYSILLLLSVALFSCTTAEVLQLGDSDFQSKLSGIETALVMFYAPWCGHCKRLKPEFDKASKDLAENDPPVSLVKVDCTEEGKESCSKFGVSGYPTLKIFRDGELSADYNGPREAAGIVKYMKAQVGPASKELKTLDEAKAFLSKNEVGVVYFGEASNLKDAFMKVANKMRETVRFAHSSSKEISKEYGYDEAIVLFRPSLMTNVFEESKIKYTDGDVETFIKLNFHGLVGHRTPDVAADFKEPVVIAYYKVDYIKNAKGTNYWRNRILKVAKEFSKDFTFAISAVDDFQHELNEFGLDYVSGEKPAICARNSKGQKFPMKGDFSIDALKTFLTDLKADKLEPYLKSEEIPESQGPVKIAVAKNFAEIVTNSGKDALVEFYAPWCGHCKKLAPIYDELGEKFANEDVDIIKMDASANDVPPEYNVRGFPTIYWKPKTGKPVPYNGGREVNDFITYIAKEASEELKGWNRKGAEKKTEL